MRFRVELSAEAERHLSQFPRSVQDRLGRALDEMEAKEDLQWSNVKALQGTRVEGAASQASRPLSDHLQEVS